MTEIFHKKAHAEAGTQIVVYSDTPCTVFLMKPDGLIGYRNGRPFIRYGELACGPDASLTLAVPHTGTWHVCLDCEEGQPHPTNYSIEFLD